MKQGTSMRIYRLACSKYDIEKGLEKGLLLMTNESFQSFFRGIAVSVFAE